MCCAQSNDRNNFSSFPLTEKIWMLNLFDCILLLCFRLNCSKCSQCLPVWVSVSLMYVYRISIPLNFIFYPGIASCIIFVYFPVVLFSCVLCDHKIFGLKTFAILFQAIAFDIKCITAKADVAKMEQKPMYVWHWKTQAWSQSKTTLLCIGKL